MNQSIANPPVSALRVKGFLPQDDHSKIDILRYMPLERFLSLLEFEAMWFSRLDALQDKYECTDPKGARGKILELVESRGADAEETPFGSWAQLLARMEQGRCGDDGRKGFAVNCWFIGKMETEKMWSEYGDRGTGVAIRSTVSRLATVFQITGDYANVSFVGRVNYVDYKSHSLGELANDVARLALIKGQAYAEENEVRILTLCSYHSGCLYPDGSQAGGFRSPTYTPATKGMYIKCRLQGLIRTVIIGPNTGQHFRIVMKKILARYGLTIEVEHSQLPRWR
jgi:hypothetical protein